MSHILQSSAWESFQNDLGLETFRHEGEGWIAMGVQEMGAGHTPRLYVPYGPDFDTLPHLEEALADVEDESRRRGDVFVRVEPVGDTPEAEEGLDELLEAHGYHKAKHLQAEDTWILDVSPDTDTLLKGMNANHRRRYRGAAKRGVSVRVSHDPADIHHLVSFMGAVEERDDVTLRGGDYITAFAKSLMPSGTAALYLAEADLKDDEDNFTGNKRVVAADLVCYDEDTCYLMHNGTDSAFYKLGANVIMQVQIVLDAHELGKHWVDFYGVAPEGAGPEHPWYGFSKFKMEFGGKRRHYHGTWEKPLKAARYNLYEAARKMLNQ